jgi:Tol biopolymer transport system component
VNTAGGETGHVWPSFLDAGRHVVFLVTSSDPSRAGIWIAAIDAPESRRRLIAADAQPIVARSVQAPSPKPQAHTILFLNDQTLLAQPLDAETLDPSGRSTPVALMVGRGPLGQVFATASHDVMIYGPPGTNLRELRWVSRDGNTVGRASEPVDAWDLRIAPDGRRVAVTEVDPQLRTLDVFIREGSQPVGTRLSLSTDIDESGVWSPDGLRIAWAGGRRHVMIRGAGAVLPEQTIASFDPPVQVWDWSRDGRALLVGRTHADTRDDLWIQPPTEGAAAQPYVTTAFNQTFGVFSPDGRWVAYASDESGKFDIYIESFPRPGARIRVTTAGGTEPRWHREGTELYFRRGPELHSVALRQANGALEVAAMNRLFDAGAAVRSYDVSPDGRRFLINLPASSATRSPMTIIHHWSAFAETLRRDKP